MGIAAIWREIREHTMSEQAAPNLSKMQTIRKRELRRAMNLLHEEIKMVVLTENGPNVYGLRVAISILGKMRKDINNERP